MLGETAVRIEKGDAFRPTLTYPDASGRGLPDQIRPPSAALAAAGIGSWEFTPANGLLRCDLTAAGLLGGNFGENAVPLDQALACIHRDDRAVLGLRLELTADVGADLNNECRVVDPDGKLRWIWMTASRVVPPGGDSYVTGTLIAISDPSHADEGLRDMAETLRLVQEAAEIGSYRVGLDGHIRCSAQFCSQLGLPPDTVGLDFRDFLDLVHPDDRDRVKENARHALSGSHIIRQDFRIVRADTGDIRWLSSRSRSEQGPDGKMLRCIGAHLDITERKRAEEALREREAQLATVFRQACVGLLHRDLNNNVLMVNERYCAIVGRTAAELQGLPMEAFTHPDDMVWNGPLFESHARSGQSFTTEKRYVRPDDSIVWCAVDISFVPGPDGAPVSIIVVANDISDRRAAEAERKQAAALLLEREAQLRLVQEAALIGTFTSTPEGRSICSQQFYRNLGLPEDTPFIDSDTRFALIHPDDRARVERELTGAQQSGAVQDVKYRIMRVNDGAIRWIYARTKYERAADGSIVNFVGAHMDVTTSVAAELALQQSETLNRNIIDASADCIKLLTIDGTLRFMNEFGLAALEIKDAATIYGKNWTQLWPHGEQHKVEAALVAARQGQVGRFNAGCPTARGNLKWWDVVVTPLRDEQGSVKELLSISRDVTELRNSMERVRWTARHDALTELSNRSYFHERLGKTLVRARETNSQVGLLALDVDDFKQVNDALGHDAGDMLLKALAARLQGVVRRAELVARLGGDEFAIIVPRLTPQRDLLTIADDILSALKEPLIYDGRVIDCRVSIGAALYPEHGREADKLLKNADIALYAAKSGTRTRALLFEPEMRSGMQRRTAMIRRAREALDDNHVLPFYQPKVGFRSGQVAGFEALLRWRHPQRGIQPPSTIVAAFEDLEIANSLSERMQDRVIADMRRWLDEGVDFGHVALNASSVEFRRDNFAERLLERLSASRIPNSCFELEVTETVFLGRGADRVERALRDLAAAGIRIALDDFGTGYASLSHLKQFPVDIIKIDQSFVRDLEAEEGDAAIVRALLNLGANLGIGIVAEGIETESQAAFLAQEGCDVGQGYFFGKPIDASCVPELLSTWRPPAFGRKFETTAIDQP